MVFIFRFKLSAHNVGAETVRVTGGQFYLYDSIDDNKHDAVFIGYGDR